MFDLSLCSWLNACPVTPRKLGVTSRHIHHSSDLCKPLEYVSALKPQDQVLWVLWAGQKKTLLKLLKNQSYMKDSGFISFIAYKQKTTKTMKRLVRKEFYKGETALGLRPQKNTTWEVLLNRSSKHTKRSKNMEVYGESSLSKIPSPEAKIIS